MVLWHQEMRSVDLVWESRAELATSSHHTLRELDKVVLRNAILCQNTGICWWGVVGFHHHLPLSQMLSRRVQPARRARRLQVGGGFLGEMMSELSLSERARN